MTTDDTIPAAMADQADLMLGKATLATAKHGGCVQLGDGLLPCPFCGDALTINGAGDGVHPRDSDCILAQHVVVADHPPQVAAWNRRALSAQPSPFETLPPEMRSGSPDYLDDLDTQPSPAGQDAPWPEIDMILADAYSAGAAGLQFEGIARRAALRAALAASTASQPEYLHGSDELRARVDGERAAYMEGLEEGKLIAAHQPVGKIVAWQHCGENHEHMVISDSRKKALKEGETEKGIRKIDAAYSIPLVRQPVGEPFGYCADFDPGTHEFSHTFYYLAPGETVPAGCTAFYAAPPAQAVDLGRFRPAVMTALGLSSPYGLERKTLNELLDLIDSQAVGK